MPTRIFGLIAAAAMLGVPSIMASPARAEIQYPWCAQYSDHNSNGGTNCGFVTLQQCRDTISGLGGVCYENPMYPGRNGRVDTRRRH